MRLNALCSVDHQQGTFASGNASRNLIREIHMSRSVNQVQDILLAIKRILHLNGVTLDGDAALLFQIHIVEHLAFGYLNGIRALQQSVGNR